MPPPSGSLHSSSPAELYSRSKRGEFACARHEQGQVFVGQRPYLRQVQDVAPAVHVAVSHVGHHELAVGQQALEVASGFGKAAGLLFVLVGIEQHFVHQVAGMAACHVVGKGVGLPHVAAAVAVVAQEAQPVAPRAEVVALHVADDFVHHFLGLLRRQHRQAAYADVDAVASADGRAFRIVQQAEIVVRAIRLRAVGRGRSLEGEQLPVARAGQAAAVVERTFPHQQQIFECVIRVPVAVVQHLAHAAVGRGVGRAGGKLVVHLLGRDHRCPQTAVVVGVGQCQPFGSLLEVGMGDDQHVRRLHAVQVLGGHFVQQRGCGNIGCRFGVERHVGFHPVGLVHETHGLSRTFHRYLLRLLRVGHVHTTTSWAEVDNS